MLKYANNLKDISRTRKGSRRARGRKVEKLSVQILLLFPGQLLQREDPNPLTLFQARFFLVVSWCCGQVQSQMTSYKRLTRRRTIPHKTKKHPLEVPPWIYIFITNIRGTNFFGCHDFIRIWNSAFNCRVQTPLEIALTPFLRTLRWFYKGWFATTIFSETQRCNVGTMFYLFETMSQQCCNTVLR